LATQIAILVIEPHSSAYLLAKNPGMLRTKKRKKKNFDAAFDITPMIDVVLLLLIFFMVSARMAPQNAAKLPLAKHGDMAAMHDAVVLIVRPGSTESANVSTLTGRKFSTNQDVQSAEIAEYVESAFQDPKKKYLLIQGEPKVLTSQMISVQLAARTVLSPEQDIMIAVEQ
jgi:biopolymer transport protein ExbD